MSSSVTGFGAREWRDAGILFVAYFVVYVACAAVIPASAWLFPASAVALGGLYFGGIRLWPVIAVAALIAGIVAGLPTPLLLTLVVAEPLAAVAGAYLFHWSGIDPLFRRYRDTFYLFLTVLLVSLIAPTLFVIADAATVGVGPSEWVLRYTATLFCLLIGTPFILRWVAKSRFGRTPLETLEIVAVFGLLIGIEALIYMNGVRTLGGVPLMYLLIVPFFWIALRLRPRFVTLALLITSLFAIGNVIAVSRALPLAMRLFNTEALLITVAAAFFIIVSLEEDRRVNTNLMRSQLSTLENAVSRVMSESKAKNDFIAILAHELRNPLAPVLSSIELMKLKGTADSENAAALDLMEDRMGTVRRLLDDLLDISRISEGKTALSKETVELGTIIRRAVVSTEHHRVERHQSLSLSKIPASLCLYGDPVRLEQVFSNLLTNASKYSDAGDQIRVVVAAENGFAEVAVTDTGIGILPENLDKIFTPFHQVELGSRSRSGLGIGLALVRNFAEMHGGSVTAKSQGSGRGSTFVVRLPLAEGRAPLPDAGSDGVEAPPRNKKGPLVLIVDDNDAAAGGMGKLLELKGCRVGYAYDGGQGIDQARKLKPDVILLDIGLPDQDGYAVAKKLRTQGYAGRLIALTGYSTDDAKQRGALAGFDEYLVKPTGLADLKRVIPELG